MTEELLISLILSMFFVLCIACLILGSAALWAFLTEMWAEFRDVIDDIWKHLTGGKND